MSGQVDLKSDLNEEVAIVPLGSTAEPQIPGNKKPHENNSIEGRAKITDKEEEVEGIHEEDQEEEEEEVTISAHLEPSTLPWPGDKDRRPEAGLHGGVGLDSRVSEADGGGSPDLSGGQSQAESDRKSKAKWRESMPEGERWREDGVDDTEARRHNGGDGSLADDEDEEEEEEEKRSSWIAEKAALGFTPQVTIVRPSSKELPEESRLFIESDGKEAAAAEPDGDEQFYQEWKQQDDKYYLCEHLCSEKLKLVVATVAAGILFPLLVWGGYALLPFDPPLVDGPPLRVVYTLRCAFFASIPILLGVVVQGVARLRYGALRPLYHSTLVSKEVAVHWHYVNESLALFLFFFLQLAVMATYISQDLVKLVPLLTITFVFGRLVYWLCLSLDSSVRGLGFGLSFFPILAMLAANLYYVCSSVGQGAVFAVAPPTTPPPPAQKYFWG